MTTRIKRINGRALSALVMLSLMSGCSAASTDGKVPSKNSQSISSATVSSTDPAVTALARQFEPRVLALLQKIARDKRISRRAIEAELRVKLEPVATAPNRPREWDVYGLFEPGHGFRITLLNRETDMKLSVSASETGTLGCHMHTDPLRAALVDGSRYEASQMGQGKRPFTLLNPTDNSRVTVRLFDHTITDASGNKTNCTYLLDVTAPGV
jgi:hypothetical protein